MDLGGGDGAVKPYFNKFYDFKNNGWSLPSKVYVEDKWILQEMQQKKLLLNAVKTKLDNFDLSTWSLHTRKRDPSSAIIKAIRNNIQPELLTQAWCKFFECLSKHPDIIPDDGVGAELKSLHLCEAPGGFISALNHYLHLRFPNIKLEWNASTLNPSYEGNPLNRMIPDDRLIVHTKKRWMFGADLTGDITKDYNYEDLTEKVLRNGKVDLVTADGSINCMDDPGDQERHVEHLHYCETMTALTVLRLGGSFMLKIFTTFEESTICLLYLLTCCFEAVRIFKPITSKSGNSETYVICLRYGGFGLLESIWPRLIIPYKNTVAVCKKSMFRLEDVDREFLRQIDECAEFFMRKQMHTINENVWNFLSNSNNAFYENVKLRTLHEDITNHFLSIYRMGRIEYSKKLVPTKSVHRFNKTYQLDEKASYKCYYMKEVHIPVEFVVGKRVETVFYSKYTAQHLLESKPQVRTLDARSLFNLARRALKNQFVIVDYKDYESTYSSNQWDFECKLLKTIFSHLGLDMIFINVPIRSTLLANVFYLLCNSFEHNYFFRRGLMVLSGFDANMVEEVGKHFDKVRQFLESEKDDDDVYRRGLIEIVDEMSVNFLKCLWFYNNNLLFQS